MDLAKSSNIRLSSLPIPFKSSPTATWFDASTLNHRTSPTAVILFFSVMITIPTSNPRPSFASSMNERTSALSGSKSFSPSREMSTVSPPNSNMVGFPSFITESSQESRKYYVRSRVCPPFGSFILLDVFHIHLHRHRSSPALLFIPLWSMQHLLSIDCNGTNRSSGLQGAGL